MNIDKFPRRRYTDGFTPIEKLNRFSDALDGPEIYIKRDDLTGLTLGGNKTRKLEFVIANALKKGCDTIITCGAVQSNSCRLTLSAAIKENLKCRLLLLEHEPTGLYDPNASGNNLLFNLLEAEQVKVIPHGADAEAKMKKMADEATAEGRKPYIIEGNYASALAALGHVVCAQEILGQMNEKGICFDQVICPSGSGGTHGGLLTGFFGFNHPIPVNGINIRRGKAEQEKRVLDVIERTVELAESETKVPREAVVCFDDYYQPGYMMPNPEMIEAVRLLAKTEGILLDPCYSGKAMAGLIDLIRNGYFKNNEKILFIHTGGSPALFAYLDTFLQATE